MFGISKESVHIDTSEKGQLWKFTVDNVSTIVVSVRNLD